MSDKKPMIIPPKVQEMADFIQKSENDPNCAGYVIIQGRRWGRTMATNIAKNTKDTEYEIVQPKLIDKL